MFKRMLLASQLRRLRRQEKELNRKLQKKGRTGPLDLDAHALAAIREEIAEIELSRNSNLLTERGRDES